MAVPWRERPRDLAGSAQARGHGGGRSRHDVSASAGAGRRGTRASGRHRRRAQSARREQRPSRSDCAARNSRAQGAARCSRSAPPMLRMAVGLDRATRGPVSGQLSTAAAEVLDDDERRRYFLNHLRRLRVAAPSTSPGVEHVRIAGLRPRFVPQFSIHFLVVCSCDVTSANPMIEPDCVSASGQAQIRPCNHVEVVTLPRRYACQSSMRQEPHSVRPFTAERDANRHRRSEWAGVSWPKDDDNERDAAARHRTHARANDKERDRRQRTSRFARSFVRWRGRRHASASSWN